MGYTIHTHNTHTRQAGSLNSIGSIAHNHRGDRATPMQLGVKVAARFMPLEALPLATLAALQTLTSLAVSVKLLCMPGVRSHKEAGADGADDTLAFFCTGNQK